MEGAQSREVFCELRLDIFFAGLLPSSCILVPPGVIFYYEEFLFVKVAASVASPSPVRLVATMGPGEALTALRLLGSLRGLMGSRRSPSDLFEGWWYLLLSTGRISSCRGLPASLEEGAYLCCMEAPGTAADVTEAKPLGDFPWFRWCEALACCIECRLAGSLFGEAPSLPRTFDISFRMLFCSAESECYTPP